MGRVVGEEGVEVGLGGLALAGGHGAADEHAGAVTDEGGDFGGGELLEAMRCHETIEAGAKVGERVDEGSVEVED